MSAEVVAHLQRAERHRVLGVRLDEVAARVVDDVPVAVGSVLRDVVGQQRLGEILVVELLVAGRAAGSSAAPRT